MGMTISQPFWLDFWLFGNGHGLAQPHWDGVYYWLVDRDSRVGRFYTFSGWFGSQLQSIEWLTPRPGTRRTLKGREFVVFSAVRAGPRVRVSWAMTRMPKDLNEANAAIRQFGADLLDSMK